MIEWIALSVVGAAVAFVGAAVAVAADTVLPAAPAEAQAAHVSAANWYWGPANRWSWHNTRRIFPSSQISRGTGPVSDLPAAARDLSTVIFTDPVTRQPMSVGAMLDATFTDGFLVLQRGHILTETYRNGLAPLQPHLLMSVSKSIMGTLAGILVGRGELDPGKLVTDYVPEMKKTVYEGATVRNLLDMSVDDPDERAALKSAQGTAKEYEAVDEAGGWLPPTAASAPGLRAYLMRLRRPRGENGKSFLYLDQSAILIGWVMERASGKDLSDLLGAELWAKLGAEQDAYMLLDHHQQAYSSAGFNATLRDLGRFGDMMSHGGRYNGQQIVPQGWVDDIRSNGLARSNGAAAAEKSDQGLAAPAPWPGHRHGTYRSFWWLSEAACGRFAGVGLGGQLLIIDPSADMVVVKFDSVPSPALDEKTFRTEYFGIDAIIKTVSGHGCDS